MTWDEADVARFMAQVDILPNGCWFWTGGRSRGKGNRKWYGSFSCQGVTVRAHRFSHVAIGGARELEPGEHRGHECHFSLCVEPFTHLRIMTRAENQAQKMERANGS